MKVFYLHVYFWKIRVKTKLRNLVFGLVNATQSDQGLFIKAMQFLNNKAQYSNGLMQ